MHRLFNRFVIVCLNKNSLVMQTNHQRKHISWLNHSDDLRDIPEYVEARHLKFTKVHFIGFLTTKLSCPPQRATQICTDYPKFSHRTLQEVSRNMNFLTLKNVTQDLILDNPWMLTLNHAQLKSNIHILEEMQPKNINDFAPLAIIPSEKLKIIQEIAKEEAITIPNNHRIYYISELLHVNPCVVSKYVSNHSFVLEMPFNELDSRLKAMLEYIIPGDVVHHLRSLKLSEKTLSKKSNAQKSIAQYYSDRLKCDIETVETMLTSHPKIRTCNVRGIGEKLDYLLNEAGIPASDIVRNPYILLTSLQTIKERIQEIQSLGCHNYNLRYINRSTKMYNEYLKSLKNQLNKE